MDIVSTKVELIVADLASALDRRVDTTDSMAGSGRFRASSRTHAATLRNKSFLTQVNRVKHTKKRNSDVGVPETPIYPRYHAKRKLPGLPRIPMQVRCYAALTGVASSPTLNDGDDVGGLCGKDLRVDTTTSHAKQ